MSEKYNEFLNKIRIKFPTKDSFVKFLIAYYSYFVRKTGIESIDRSDITLENSPIYQFWTSTKSNFFSDTDNVNWFFFIMNTIVENQKLLKLNKLNTDNLKIKSFDFFKVQVNHDFSVISEYEYFISYVGYATKRDIESEYNRLLKNWDDYKTKKSFKQFYEVNSVSNPVVSNVQLVKSLTSDVYE